MDEAGAGLGGDVIAEQHRHVVVVAAAAQRMRGRRCRRARRPSARARRDASRCRRPCRTAAADRAPPAASRRRGRATSARRRRHAPARSRTPRRRRWRGCRASSRASWSRSPPRRRPGRCAGAHAPGSAPRSSCEVWSWYSISASASAVFSTGDHITGRRPRYSAPFSRNLQISAAIAASDAMVHRRVALAPVALDAEAAELGRLHRQPVLRIGAALGAEVQHRHRVLVLLGLAVLLLDLPLDRQAVAVPAGDVVGVVAGHLARCG